MLMGYARVSTDAQSLDAQMAALKAAGCERLYAEKRSGAETDRKALAKLMKEASPGDTVVVTRLDRLARSTRDLLNLLDRLGKDNIGFKSLRETSVDTTSPQGRLVVNILASISEFERELIHARMTEGRKRAVANGVKCPSSSSIHFSDRKHSRVWQQVRASQLSPRRMASTPPRSRACKGRRLAPTRAAATAHWGVVSVPGFLSMLATVGHAGAVQPLVAAQVKWHVAAVFAVHVHAFSDHA